VALSQASIAPSAAERTSGSEKRMQAALIANPYSSGMTPKRERAIVKRLREYVDLEVLRTERRGHASELAGEAVDAGVDLVIACGGDGTGNEVINGMRLDEGTADERPMFALLPGGATNVLARSLGYTNNPVKASNELALALAGRRWTAATLGKMDERLFLFAAGIGLDGATVRQIEHRRSGRRPSDLAHAAALLGTFADERGMIREKMTVTVEDTGEVLRAGTVFCANTSPFTYMGRLPTNILPEANLENGLAMLCPEKMSLPFLIGFGAGSMGLGRKGKQQRRSEKGQTRNDISHISIECDSPQPCQLDGEFVGERTHIHLHALKRAVRMVH
jgi:diacylglycerol kinase family enzyme